MFPFAGRRKGMMESFLEEFGLTNSEGLALMCLAEALLRVPDTETKDDLIAEKIRSGDWGAHKGQSDSWLVNASTWGLMLTGRVIGAPESAKKGPSAFLGGLIRESGEPVIRAAMMQAMRIMGEQFVLGPTVREALKRGRRMVKSGEAAHFSFDMLGEGARTSADASGPRRESLASATARRVRGKPRRASPLLRRAPSSTTSAAQSSISRTSSSSRSSIVAPPNLPGSPRPPNVPKRAVAELFSLTLFTKW